MGELEQFKQQIISATSQHFSFYEMLSAFEDDETIIWFKEDDINKFLNIAQKLGVKLLYLYENTTEDPAHPGESDTIHIAYVYNEMIHLFVKDASWAKDDDETSVEE